MTLYATLGPSAIAHGLNETEVTHIITSKDLLHSRLKVIRHIIELQSTIVIYSHFKLDAKTSQTSASFSSSQPILCDVPRLQYVIVVDSKPTSWPDIPRGITIYNIDAVKELGSKPENCKCFQFCLDNIFVFCTRLQWLL